MPSRSPDKRRERRHSRRDASDDEQRQKIYSRSRSPVRFRYDDRRDRGRDRGDVRDSEKHSEHRRRHDDHHRQDYSRRSQSPRRDHSRDDGSFRPRHRGGEDAWLSQEMPQPGSIYRATVRNIRPFGAFIELEGFRRHGLVHNNQISEEVTFSREDEDEAKMKAMEFFAPVGSKVWAKVVEVRDDNGGPPKVNCSMKVVSQEDGSDLDPNSTAVSRGGGGRGRGGGDMGFRGPQRDAPPEVGSIMQASVASVKPYGIFVRLKGFRANGLVHLSQISDHLEIGKDESDEDKVNALSAVHAVGDPLWVKVVEVTDDGSERGPKVACSIKLVDQREGTDLDPHNVKWQPRGEGGPGGPRGPAQPAAVVTQGGTVDWGHLKAGDVQYGDSKQYEYVGNEVLAMLPPPPPPVMAEAHNGHAQAAADPGRIGTVEEAMAILEKYGKGGKKRAHNHKKAKKKGKDKKSKKEKKAGKKRKKEKKDKREPASSSDSDSDE